MSDTEDRSHNDGEVEEAEGGDDGTPGPAEEQEEDGSRVAEEDGGANTEEGDGGDDAVNEEEQYVEHGEESVDARRDRNGNERDETKRTEFTEHNTLTPPVTSKPVMANAKSSSRIVVDEQRQSQVSQPPEILTDLDVVHNENAKMRTRLSHLESERLQSRVQLDRLTAEIDRLTHRLNDATKERDELREKVGVDEATLKLLEGRLRESEERILSFNQLLDQAIEPYRTKLKQADQQLAKLQKENEMLKTKKLQLLDKALDLKLRLKTHALEHNMPVPRPTPMSPDVEVYGAKYRRLPGIGREEGGAA
ncbi:hypothetical protein HDV00_006884 [Rhizophlyctis rosea]|nr:hypothetical protein HDV00_006884 [Rhizophlyctis rosea]